MKTLNPTRQEVKNFFAQMGSNAESREEIDEFLNATAVCLGAAIVLYAKEEKSDELADHLVYKIRKSVRVQQEDPAAIALRKMHEIAMAMKLKREGR